MKESKFIELLNLYIDHQISPEEAARLEEEILQDPRRRQTYNQYCRMQRACTLVLDQFKSPVDGAGKAAGDIVGFEATKRRFRWEYLATGLAAAASLALVGVQIFIHSGGNLARTQIAAAPVGDSAPSRSDPVRLTGRMRVESPAARHSAETEMFISEQLRVITPTGAVGNLPLLAASPQIKLAPLSAPEAAPAPRSVRPSIEQFVFAPEPPSLDTPRIFRNRQQTAEEAVRAALEYHR